MKPRPSGPTGGRYTTLDQVKAAFLENNYRRTKRVSERVARRRSLLLAKPAPQPPVSNESRAHRLHAQPKPEDSSPFNMQVNQAQQFILCKRSLLRRANGLGICSKLVENLQQQDTANEEKQRSFLEDTLRRTQTTFSVLLVCIVYLIRYRRTALVPVGSFPKAGASQSGAAEAMETFLVALLLAKKYLSDKHVANKQWLDLLQVSAIQLENFNSRERTFLEALGYDLAVEPQLVKNLATLLLQQKSQ